jgi:hypothetical protein
VKVSKFRVNGAITACQKGVQSPRDLIQVGPDLPELAISLNIDLRGRRMRQRETQKHVSAKV